MKLRVIARLIEIQRVLVRHGLDEFVRATHLYRPLRFLFLLVALDLGGAPRATNRAPCGCARRCRSSARSS